MYTARLDDNYFSLCSAIIISATTHSCLCGFVTYWYDEKEELPYTNEMIDWLIEYMRSEPEFSSVYFICCEQATRSHIHPINLSLSTRVVSVLPNPQ